MGVAARAAGGATGTPGAGPGRAGRRARQRDRRVAENRGPRGSRSGDGPAPGTGTRPHAVPRAPRPHPVAQPRPVPRTPPPTAPGTARCQEPPAAVTAAPRPAGGCGTPPGPTAPCAASARCCPAAGTQPSPAATPDTDDGERGSPSPGHCAGRCDAGREGAAPRGDVCAPTAPCAPPRSAAEARGWILDPSGERYYWWLSAMVLPVLYNWVVIICRCGAGWGAMGGGRWEGTAR